jgi:hypothetical protein
MKEKDKYDLQIEGRLCDGCNWLLSVAHSDSQNKKRKLDKYGK